jgi:hypothetical protein
MTRLWDAADAWFNLPGRDEAVRTRLFAVPLLLVTGGATGTVPGVLPDAPALVGILEKSKALGPLQHFALSPVLCALESLQGAALIRLRQSALPQGSAVPSGRADVPPSPIQVTSVEEGVHLRFMVGAAVSPAQAPDITETAGQVGAWGMEFARELSAQLRVPGMSLLAIPRAPVSPLWARHRGHFARQELSVTLGLSRALRQFRSRVGEPDVVIAACEDGLIRLALTSPFDPASAACLTWALHPLDDLRVVEQSIASMLADFRVDSATWMESVCDARMTRLPVRQ